MKTGVELIAEDLAGKEFSMRRYLVIMFDGEESLTDLVRRADETFPNATEIVGCREGSEILRAAEKFIHEERR